MKVCKPFGPTLFYEKSEYDAESNITKRVPYKQKTLVTREYELLRPKQIESAICVVK